LQNSKTREDLLVIKRKRDYNRDERGRDVLERELGEET
jgi:hypothetical protein